MDLLLLALLVLVGTPLLGGGAPPEGRIVLEVREAAGIRRFGYPVSAEFEPRKDLAGPVHFRLLLDGGPVPAQFRRLEVTAGSPPRVALDFEGSFLPFEARRYTVEYGPEIQAGPEPERGLRLEETAEAYRVLNGAALSFTIRKGLEGLLASVTTPGGDFLKPGSRGLVIHGSDGLLHPIAGPPSRRLLLSSVVRSGPLAVSLRFEGGEGLVLTRVEIEIPRSKSWAKVSLAIDDPAGLVAGVEADLALNLGEESTLADFGAAGLVYAALRPGQAALFRAGFPAAGAGDPRGPFWEVLRGPAGKLEPYVEGPRGPPTAPLQGWAHAMDRDRCTAAAMKDFASDGEDRLEVIAGRGLRIGRAFASPLIRREKKSLVFWLHFVSMPPHVGAVTSPESMASPLETRWIRE